MASKQDLTYARTASDIERKYNFGKSFSEAMELAEQAKRQADEAYSVAVNIKGIFFFVRYSAYADGTNMTVEPQADTVYMGTCSANVDVAPADKTAYTWTKILGNDGANGEKGEKGEDGAKGDDGVGVSNMVAQYVVTNNKTTPPKSGWSTTMPNWTTGSYLWIRHIVYYTNGDEVPTEPMCDSSWEAVNILNNTLNHDEVFNRLTNNGTQQGIYKDKNGDIYINGEYVEFEGATIGGWKITKNALYKDVTISGVDYRVYFQPPIDGAEKTWVLSCQQKADDGKYYGNFILFSDGSARFGNMVIRKDGEMVWDDTGDRGYAPLAILRENEKMWMQIDSVVVRDDPTDAYHATNKKYVDNNFLLLSGGTLTGNLTISEDKALINKGNRYIHQANGIQGTSGYINFARVTIVGTYANQEIYFRVSRRGHQQAQVYLYYENSGNTTPAASSFQRTGTFDIYIHNVAGGVWDLYCYRDPYDAVEVLDFTMGKYNDDRIDVTWRDVQVSALPAGYYNAILRTENMSISGNASTADVASAISNWSIHQGYTEGNYQWSKAPQGYTSIYQGTDAAEKGVWMTGLTLDHALNSAYKMHLAAPLNTNQLFMAYTNSGNISEWVELQGITAQATSGHGIWSFIKFNSGIAMCWGKTTNVSSAFSSTWGNWYVHDGIFSSHTYPFDFVDIPRVFATQRMLDGGSYTTGDYFLYTNANGTNKKTPAFSAARPTKPSAAITMSIELLAIGRWK